MVYTMTRSFPNTRLDSAPKAMSKPKTSVQPAKQKCGQANERCVFSIPWHCASTLPTLGLGKHGLLGVQAETGEAARQPGEAEANGGFERQNHAAQVQQSSATALTHAAADHAYAEDQPGCASLALCCQGFRGDLGTPACLC